MKILILGGTGFTGRHVTHNLASKGHEVRVLHRGQHPLELPAPLPSGAPPIRKVNVDLAMLATYGQVLRQWRFDAVLHLMAMTRSDARSAVSVLADYVPRIVVAPSQDVYSAFGALIGREDRSPAADPIDEASPLRSSRYIRGDQYEKLDVEEEFLHSAHRLPVTILRMPATYGPDDPRHRFFPLVKRLQDDRPAILLELSYGNFRWSHAYVENVAHAFALALATPHRDHESVRIYNVSETGTPSTAQRADALVRAAGYRSRIIVVPRDRCPPHLIMPGCFEHELVVSDSALRRDLGYTEIVPTDEALRRTVAWQLTCCPLEVDPAEFDYAAEDRLLKTPGVE